MGAAAAATAVAASGCAPPQVKVENETWQIFVTSLSRRSVALQVSFSISRDCLVNLLAETTWVPAGSFYLLRNGKAWRDEDRLRRGDVVRMAGRLHGGTRPPPVFIPGQWTCTSCGMEGCWPSKMRCFRCLAPRPVVNCADSSRPVFGKGNARERSYPGQSSVARNPTNPTFRHLPTAGAPAPMPVGPVSPTAPPVVDLTDAATITNVLQLLAGLGVSDALLQQTKSSIPPPATGKQKNAGPEKQLQIITGKITVLEQQVVKLEEQKDRLVRELDECHASRADKESQLELLRAQYREVRDTGKFMPTRVSPAPSVRAASVAGDEVPSRDVNMEDVGAAVGSSAGAGGEQASGSSGVLGRLMPMFILKVLLLRLGRFRLILAREGVWKLLGLLRLKRSLLGGGTTLNKIAETFSRCFEIGWKNISKCMRLTWRMVTMMIIAAWKEVQTLR